MSKRIENSRTAMRAERDVGHHGNQLNNIADRSPIQEKVNQTEDATGLEISVSLRTDMRYFTDAIRNVNEGINLLSLIDGLVDNLKGKIGRLHGIAKKSEQGSSRHEGKKWNEEAENIADAYHQIIDLASIDGQKLFGAFPVKRTQPRETVNDKDIKLSFVISNDNWASLGIADFNPEGKGELKYFIAIETEKHNGLYELDDAKLSKISGLDGLKEAEKTDLIKVNMTVLGPTKVADHLLKESQSLANNKLLLSVMEDPAEFETEVIRVQSELEVRKGLIEGIKEKLKQTAKMLYVYGESFNTSKSRIVSVDHAEEAAAKVKSSISKQTLSAMFAQANQHAELAIPLLRAA